MINFVTEYILNCKIFLSLCFREIIVGNRLLVLDQLINFVVVVRTFNFDAFIESPRLVDNVCNNRELAVSVSTTVHKNESDDARSLAVVSGDEVIAWNGRSLQGKSFREVYDIIAESRLEPQIELIVERKLSTMGMAPAGPGPSTPMSSRRIVAQSQWRQKHETISGPPTPHHKGDYTQSTFRFRPSSDLISLLCITNVVI